MKSRWIIFKKFLPWLLMILTADLFFSLLLWIADIQALYSLSMLIIIFSLLLFSIILLVLTHHETRFKKEFKNYISYPTKQNEEALICLCHDSDKDLIQLLGTALREKEYENNQLLTRILDYEEYVEAWAHETKTPLSLLTILLDNHKEELPGNISLKMEYIRNRLQEYVDQMMFYARLKGGKKDYFFEELSLSEIIEDILQDYQPLLEEKQFLVQKHALETTVFSDKRGLRFLLSQIISNSIKYTRKDSIPELTLAFTETEENNMLIITDNGIGVKSCDFPYIFEKGFTGDSGESRKKATGMGLYLANEVAAYLKLELEAETKWMHGFKIRFLFPK